MTTGLLSNYSLFASLSEVPLKNGIVGSGSHLGPKLSKLAFSSRRIESKMVPSKFLLLGSGSQVDTTSSKWTWLRRGIEPKMFPPKFRSHPPLIWFENLAILLGAPPTSTKPVESLDDVYTTNIGLKPWKMKPSYVKCYAGTLHKHCLWGEVFNVSKVSKNFSIYVLFCKCTHTEWYLHNHFTHSKN